MMSISEITSAQNPWWERPNLRAALRFPVRRDLQPLVVRRLLHQEDRRAVAIVGPRQVGKTVMLQQALDDLLEAGWPPGNISYFDFSDHRLTAPILPSEVVEVLPPTLREDHPCALLFDEVSRAESWDRWLKDAVDRGGCRIAVTDSAASLLRHGTRESGQGRWDEFRLEGLTFAEALRFLGRTGEAPREAFAARPELLERYLGRGGFPELFLSPLPVPGDLGLAARLRSDIVDRAVYRDFQRFGVDVEAVKNLFVYLVQESGAIFKAATRAQEIGHDYRSVQSWVRLLEQAGLLASLPRFAQRPARRLQGGRSEKLYAADHGLIAALSVPGLEEAGVRARVFEAVVFRHLRELARAHGGTLSYFRIEERFETDFVVELEGRRVGVEVTAQRQPSASKVAKCAASFDRLKADLRLLVHGGVERREAGGILALPLSSFLLDFGELVSP